MLWSLWSLFMYGFLIHRYLLWEGRCLSIFSKITWKVMLNISEPAAAQALVKSFIFVWNIHWLENSFNKQQLYISVYCNNPGFCNNTIRPLDGTVVQPRGRLFSCSALKTLKNFEIPPRKPWKTKLWKPEPSRLKKKSMIVKDSKLWSCFLWSGYIEQRQSDGKVGTADKSRCKLKEGGSESL